MKVRFVRSLDLGEAPDNAAAANGRSDRPQRVMQLAYERQLRAESYRRNRPNECRLR